jgi:hypothetical protein
LDCCDSDLSVTCEGIHVPYDRRVRDRSAVVVEERGDLMLRQRDTQVA